MNQHRPPGKLLSAASYRIVFVTASPRAADRLARGILAEKLAACVNIVPGLRSWYWWKGKVASDREVLLVIKTSSRRLPALHRWVKKHHPYEVPEFLALPVSQGDSGYLKWLQSSI